MMSASTVRFSSRSVPVPGKPGEFVEVDFIRRTVPGDSSSVVDRPVRKKDLEDAALNTAYQAWKAKTPAVDREGFPLSLWGVASSANQDVLRAVNVLTVQELALVSDANIDRLGNAYRRLRARAQEHLRAMEQSAPVQALQAELVRKDAELATTKAKTDALSAALEQLKAATPAKSAEPEAPKGGSKK